MIRPTGYFKIWRSLYSKPIWLNSTLEQQVILLTLMAMANFGPKQWEWEGKQFDVKPGQFITSLNSIKENSGNNVSIQNIRTALKRFEKLDFLTNQSTKTGRLLTLANWGEYQRETSEANIAPNKDLTKTSQRPNKDLTTREEGKEGKKVTTDYPAIISYLNEKTGKQFKHTTQATREYIDARISEGFTMEDMKRVIDNKSKQWVGDDKMSEFLRPQTLFGTKFEAYLNDSAPVETKRAGFIDYESDLGERRPDW